MLPFEFVHMFLENIYAKSGAEIEGQNDGFEQWLEPLLVISDQYWSLRSYTDKMMRKGCANKPCKFQTCVLQQSGLPVAQPQSRTHLKSYSHSRIETIQKLKVVIP